MGSRHAELHRHGANRQALYIYATTSLTDSDIALEYNKWVGAARRASSATRRSASASTAVPRRRDEGRRSTLHAGCGPGPDHVRLDRRHRLVVRSRTDQRRARLGPADDRVSGLIALRRSASAARRPSPTQPTRATSVKRPGTRAAAASASSRTPPAGSRPRCSPRPVWRPRTCAGCPTSRWRPTRSPARTTCTGRTFRRRRLQRRLRDRRHQRGLAARDGHVRPAAVGSRQRARLRGRSSTELPRDQNSTTTVTGPPPTQALGGFHDIITGGNGALHGPARLRLHDRLGTIDIGVMNGQIGH